MEYQFIPINEIPQAQKQSKWEEIFKQIPPQQALEISLKQAQSSNQSLKKLQKTNKYTNIKIFIRNKKGYITNQNQVTH